VGLCAEFSSLSWLADTPEKALEGIRNLVADVLLNMGNTGEPINSLLPYEIAGNNLPVPQKSFPVQCSPF